MVFRTTLKLFMVSILRTMTVTFFWPDWARHL